MRRALPVGNLLLMLILAVPSPLAAQTSAADTADVVSPEAIVRALYETVSRRPGEDFDWPRLRTLFLPEAIMIASVGQTGGAFRVMSVQQFIDWVDEHTLVGGTADPGFQEDEIAQRLERYGDVAQVFSTYEKRFWAASQILGRGINSIQLVRANERWWVVSVAWDEEPTAGSLPERYLPPPARER
jgi:hypothetical protein